jgi:transcription antitermination factor NusG
MTMRESDNPPMCFPEDVLTDVLTDGISWFAVYTKPRQEKAFAWDMKNRGAGYFLPLVKQKQASERRPRFSLIPLFTGYVFLKGNAGHRRAAFGTGRTVRIIDVKDQKLFCKDLNIVHTAVTNRKVGICGFGVVKGKKVRITEGPLKGMEGTVLQRKNKKELIIQFDSIDQALRIAIESDRIEAI